MGSLTGNGILKLEWTDGQVKTSTMVHSTISQTPNCVHAQLLRSLSRNRNEWLRCLGIKTHLHMGDQKPGHCDDNIYRDMNNQVYGPCKHHIPNMIKTRIRPKTGILVIRMNGILITLCWNKQVLFYAFHFSPVIFAPVLQEEQALHNVSK